MSAASDAELFDAWREALEALVDLYPTRTVGLWRKALARRGYSFCPICDLWLPHQNFVADSGYCHICIELYERRYGQVHDDTERRFDWIRRVRAREAGWSA